MKKRDRTIEIFISLMRAGLWEKSIRLSPDEAIDFTKIYALSDEQSVIGLVAAGFEFVEDRVFQKMDVLPFMQIICGVEIENQAMNVFIGKLFNKLRKSGVNALLLKGQGVAQCYSRPLWRLSGDVDLLLDDDNYSKAKDVLLPLAKARDVELMEEKHLGINIGSWVVELHGTLRTKLFPRVDKELDAIQKEVFHKGEAFVWTYDGRDILLPSPDTHVVIVFTHILQHLFNGGIGLRQVCDWCRLLWTHASGMDLGLLERRIAALGVMTEWKAFASLAVNQLGMPAEAMPMYSPEARWNRKGRHILSFILKMGRGGFNKDESYYEKYPYFVRKLISFWYRTTDVFRLIHIFPLDSLRHYSATIIRGVKAVLKGK